MKTGLTWGLGSQPGGAHCVLPEGGYEEGEVDGSSRRGGRGSPDRAVITLLKYSH